MRVLVGCEESGYIRSEFIRQGHNAYSCDLFEAADRHPKHLREDIFNALSRPWDLAIIHPPCTALTVAGNRFYADTEARKQAIEWTQELWAFATKHVERVCFEQPVSVLTLPGASKQTVHPYHFGCAELKATVLHLWNLPPLEPTNEIPREVCKPIVHHMSPGPDRSRKRGHLPWLAAPMSTQWGKL